MMNIILTAAVAVAVIGLVCGVILAVASKVMAVEEDPRFPAIRAALPGANCGACGYAGCDGYAQALASGKETRPNICVPGGASCAEEIASVLGIEAGEVEKRVAVVCCAGDCTKTDVRMNYQGVKRLRRTEWFGVYNGSDRRSPADSCNKRKGFARSSEPCISN